MDRLACVDVAALPLQLLLQAAARVGPSAGRGVVEDDRPQALVLFVERRARVRPACVPASATPRRWRSPAICRPARSPRSQIDQQRPDARRSSAALFAARRAVRGHARCVLARCAAASIGCIPRCTDWAQAVRLELQRAGMQGDGRRRVHPVRRLCARRNPSGHHGLRGRGRGACGGAARAARAASISIRMSRERLLALGIETVGDFLRLPGDGIRQRFGAGGRRCCISSPRATAGRRSCRCRRRAPHERQRRISTRRRSHTERLIFVVKRLLDSLLAALVRAGARRRRARTVDEARRPHDADRTGAAGVVDARCGAAARARPPASRRASSVGGHRHAARHGGDAVRPRPISASCCRRRAPRSRCGQPGVRATARGVRRGQRRARASVRRASARGAVRVGAARSRAAAARRRAWWRRVRSCGAFTRSRSGARLSAAEARLQAQSPEPRVRPAPSLVPTSCPADGGAAASSRDYYFAPTDDGNLRWVYYDHRQQRVFLQGGVE